MAHRLSCASLIGRKSWCSPKQPAVRAARRQCTRIAPGRASAANGRGLARRSAATGNPRRPPLARARTWPVPPRCSRSPACRLEALAAVGRVIIGAMWWRASPSVCCGAACDLSGVAATACGRDNGRLVPRRNAIPSSHDRPRPCRQARADPPGSERPVANGKVTRPAHHCVDPTIKLALSMGAAVMVTSHLGRRRRHVDEADSLAPVAARLSERWARVPLVRGLSGAWRFSPASGAAGKCR